MRLAPLALALAAGVLLLPAAEVAAHHFALIQPGALMTSPSGCTMNFVFRGVTNGKLYIGTAAHCVSREGQSVSIDDEAIGTVAWRGGVSEVDFALVEILPSLHAQVDPAVRHWGGPTAVALPGVQNAGKVLYHYGYGLGYGESELTRPRAGLLTFQDGVRYLAETTAVFGDSGSPILLSTGDALGVISHFALDQAHTDEGPTIQWVLHRAQQDKGLALELVTAPLASPEARENGRIGHGVLG